MIFMTISITFHQFKKTHCILDNLDKGFLSVSIAKTLINQSIDKNCSNSGIQKDLSEKFYFKSKAFPHNDELEIDWWPHFGKKKPEEPIGPFCELFVNLTYQEIQKNISKYLLYPYLNYTCDFKCLKITDNVNFLV